MKNIQSDHENNTQVVIASMPNGPLALSDFTVQSGPKPELSSGQVLCRTEAITVGAGQRAGLQGSASYAGAPQVGDVMGGSGIARVQSSDSREFLEGDLVRAQTGWQTFSIHEPEKLTKTDNTIESELHLGALGTNCLTAYFGMTDVGKVQKNETVLISAAAGSVGHLAGQIAKAKGAKVIGVCGSESKCSILVNELGFDAAINHQAEDFREQLRNATPNRIDVFFDNTGGIILQSALFRMAVGGRIVCCGVASQYDTSNPAPGPRGVPGLLINNRVRMQGFLIFDYLDRFSEARAAISDWLKTGYIEPRATVYKGLNSAPTAFIDLLAGTTVGTTIVKVD